MDAYMHECKTHYITLYMFTLGCIIGQITLQTFPMKQILNIKGGRAFAIRAPTPLEQPACLFSVYSLG